jgi:asparagine synthase (glutamine-hydrolysing)
LFLQILKMNYQPFCYVIKKNSSDFNSQKFKSYTSNHFQLGKEYSGQLIGNICPYLSEYKIFDSQNIIKFQDNLDKNAVDFLKSFVGDFSLVYRKSDNEIIAVRDQIGVFPLYYYNDDKILIISNDQRLMIEIPGIDLSPDEAWISSFLLSKNELVEHTFYTHIKQVPPAHILRYQDNNLKIERYWELNLDQKLPQKTDKEYIDEFRELLVQAVESRIPDGVKVGSEVSGGIDCTSVAAIAKNYLDKQQRPLYTYAHSAVDTETFSSEREAIDAYLQDLKPYKNTFVPRKLTGIRDLASHAFSLKNGVPDCHYALFSRDIYTSAKEDQVSIVFSGLGGDHGVSFKGIGSVLNDLARRKEWKKLKTELKFIHKSFLKTNLNLLKYVVRYAFFGSKLLTIENNDKITETKRKILIEFQEKYPFLADFQIRPEAKVSRKQSVQFHIKKRITDVELNARCTATTISATHFGILYRYPLLDIRLLQYFVSLPSHLYYQKGINRYIFRQVIKDFVPRIAFQPKPPANMYGWILEAYMFDYQNKLEYNLVSDDEETTLYHLYWKYRDEQCYKANDYFKDKTKLKGYKGLKN